MIKKIWLVNKYAMPPQYEPRLRTLKFAHYLKEMGYDVTVFGSSAMHNMDLNLIEGGDSYIEKYYDDIHFIHIKSSSYQKTAGVKRIWSELEFHYRLIRLAKHFDKPDLIVASTSSQFSNPVLNYAKRHGIKYIREVLDIRPDNYVDFGLISANNPIMKYLYWIKKKEFTKSDAIVASVKGIHDYFKLKKWDKENGGPVDLSKVYYINNGVDLSDFNKWKTEFILDDPELKSSKKKIIYLGSIRLVNNVEQLIKAAELLMDRDDVVFLIYGDGEDREPLIKYCAEHGLKNVVFKEKWIDPKYVPYVLSQSYLNLLNYVSSKFGKYGISASKLFQYLACGRPIVCNINVAYSLIEEKQIGFSREMKDSKEYADSIRAIIDLPENEYKAMCSRASEAAKEYDYPYLAKQMVKVIKSVE